MKDSEKPSRSPESDAGSTLPRQARARATRLELVDAAREIFARDGFEQARLEDIAAAAGKTRGAFYAHFEGKEDVFFAIFEDDLERDKEQIRAALQGRESVEQRIEALTLLLARLVKNRRRMLLAIEFKLYAIRRPQQERLATLHHAMKIRCAAQEIDQLLPELKGRSEAHKREIAVHFGALIDGLALNRLFDPRSMREADLRVMLKAGVKAAIKLDRKSPSL